MDNIHCLDTQNKAQSFFAVLLRCCISPVTCFHYAVLICFQFRALLCDRCNTYAHLYVHFYVIGKFLIVVLPLQTSIPDSECNRDPSCLSGCSTEPFSEASWEQLDKRNNDVSLPVLVTFPKGCIGAICKLCSPHFSLF